MYKRQQSIDDKLKELETQNIELKKIISDYFHSKKVKNSDHDYLGTNYTNHNVISKLDDYEVSLSQSPSKILFEDDNVNVFKNFYVNGVLSYQRGNYELAIENFNKLDFSNHSVTTKGNVLYWLSESYFNLKKYDQALKILDKLVQLKNSDKQDDGIILKGIIFKNLGKFSNAKEAYSEIVDFFPHSVYVRLAKIELSKKY